MIEGIIEEFATVRKIATERLSIARYGDGEFNLIMGRDQVAQPYDRRLSRRLADTLKNPPPGVLVGLPRIREQEAPLPEKNRQFWEDYLRRKGQRIARRLNRKVQYYSACITRPDIAPHIYCRAYWDLLKTIWAGRDVTVVQGAGGENLTTHDFLNDAARVEIVWGPKSHAFSVFDDLVEEVTSVGPASPGRLILLALGPTATAMVPVLASRQYQAVDLGHVGRFYGRFCDGLEVRDN